MKRIIFILCLSLFTAYLSAPSLRVVYIIKGTEISAYDSLIRAITTIESMNGKYVYNAKENAVGWFQIRQVRIDHYNKLTGNNYTLNDCYDYELSKRVFLFFADGKTFEKAAKDWNGSGHMTIAYWNKVKKYL